MSKKMRRSKIGWADFSGGDLNFVIRGRNCPISPGCAHCYVERDFARFGREMPEQTTVYPEKLHRLRWADFTDHGVPFRRGPGSRPIAFPCDYSDLLHDDVSEGFIMEAFLIMGGCDDVDWPVLTKRVHRLKRMVDCFVEKYGPLPSNIWCMVSVEDQQRADERIPVLLQVKAAVRGLSLEPMLGPISLWPKHWYQWGHGGMTPGPDGRPIHHHDERCSRPWDWVIVGAESGPDRRPFEVAWAEDVYQQCQAAGVPFFFKQRSGLYPGTNPILLGREIKEFPQ